MLHSSVFCCQGVISECETSLEEERRARVQLDRRVQEEQTRVRELRTALERTEEERDRLITSLRSAEDRIVELSSNENQMKNAIQQTLVGMSESADWSAVMLDLGAELLEQELEDKLSCVEEVRLIRGENEQLREEVNDGRERILELSNQLEGTQREQERDRGMFNQSNSKLIRYAGYSQNIFIGTNQSATETNHKPSVLLYYIRRTISCVDYVFCCL